MVFEYPSSFWFISEQIGHARGVMNFGNNKIKIEYDRGIKNEHVDTLGVLGELIAIEYLITNKKEFKMANLLDYNSSKNADVVVNSKRIDIKTNKHSKYSHLLVNEEAHKKGKDKIDLYWFIYILDDKTAEFYFVNYEDVSKWNCKLMKYTNAFYINREKL